MNSRLKIPFGTCVVGKWNRNRYTIEDVLGEGANGRVYLVSQQDCLYALKIGFQTLAHQLEVNALKALQKGKQNNKYLLDADDIDYEGMSYPFYVMRYIPGKEPAIFLQERGSSSFPVFGIELLRQLAIIHERGYVFGDLKPENVIVSNYGQVTLVDFGGVTEIGKAVREYTLMYDRGYWSAGGRQAEGSYDLFSFSLICIQLLKPDLLQSLYQCEQARNIGSLLKHLETEPELSRWAPVLRRFLQGDVSSAMEASMIWKKAMTISRSQMPDHTFTWKLASLFMMALALFASSVLLVIK